MFWYTLFVKTGKEEKVVDEVRLWKIPDLNPFVPVYDAMFRRNGIVTPEKRKLFPGYVFIEAPMPSEDFGLASAPYISRSPSTFKLLRYGGSYESGTSFEMKNAEQEFLRKLYNQDRCVEMSRGIIEGGRVRVIDGPLKGHESRITKVKHHKMEAVIEIELMGALREVTIGLEVVRQIE